MPVIVDAIVTLTSLLIVAAYIWSVRGHFSSPKTPRGAWLVAAAVAGSASLLIALTWTAEAPPFASVLGILCEAASGFLFHAAVRTSKKAALRFAFDPEHPASLLATGPYHYVRHPFYVSYLLFWTGWSIATWALPALIVPPVFLGLYWQAAGMEERNFAASPFAREYASYRDRVGFFFPRIDRDNR